MIHAFYHDGSHLRHDVPASEWSDLLKSAKGLLWVDLDNPNEDEIDYLSDIFNFHPLSIEDCLFPNHRPKVDDYTDYCFIIFHAMQMKSGPALAENLDVLELHFFLGSNYLVTFHEDPILLLNQVRTRCQMQPGLLAKGSDTLLHVLMDGVVDEMTRILGRLEDKLDNIEDRILRDEEGALEELNEFKAVISKFRKFAGPHRDVVRVLMSQTFTFISDRRAIYFKDIHDHLLTITETANLFREIMASTMDSYLSMVQKKMNDVMKVLTVVTVIFMPLNLLAGIGGMSEWSMMTNPENWQPGSYWMISYPVFMFLMFAVGYVVWRMLDRMKLK